MNIEIKRTVKAGNSSAVILPRAWLNQEVRVELIKKTPEIILKEVLDVAKNYIDTEKIIGIYLVGSYARNEEEKDSDIDVLIVSDNVNRKEIKIGIYSIMIISWSLLEWKLENDLFPIGPMIIEAKPLINSFSFSIMKERVNVTKKNVKWYIETTKERLRLIKEILNIARKKVDDRTTYTIVLRIRTLKMIQSMTKNRVYPKKHLIELLKKISGSNNAYEAYTSIKNGLKNENKTTKGEAEKLYEYLENQLEVTKKIVKYQGLSYFLKNSITNSNTDKFYC